jgi:N-carbamoyl-L-amino-acid hydrolase
MKRRDFIHTSSAALGAMAIGRRTTIAWEDWRVNGTRLNEQLDRLAQYGRTAEGGVKRLAFSQADVEARQYCVELMRAAGLDVHVDAVANIIGRRSGSLTEAPPLMFGSHTDTVPNGGKYDGSLGSLAAIEAARTLHEQGYRNRHPLEAVIWCDEESGLTGSLGFVGDLSRADLERRRPDSHTVAEGIDRIGGDSSRIAEATHRQGDVTAYLELHVEQGGFLDQADIDIGVVEGIVGIWHYAVTIEGFPNHAGTTPMDQRQDAMLTASEIVLAVNREVRAVEGRQVGTVGRINVEPNAPNVVPGRVDLIVELRDLSSEKPDLIWQRIVSEAEQIAQRHGTKVRYEQVAEGHPALSTPGIRRVIAEAATSLDLSHQSMPSGAGHDAQELARIGPMGMIFVPSAGGISHSPLEYTEPEDVVNGANVLLQTVLRLDQE